MNDILKPFKEYFTMNKNGEYSHLKRTMLTVFHVRFVFVLFETLGFCKSVRVVFPDLVADRTYQWCEPFLEFFDGNYPEELL